jgi:hypothetical protein
MHHATPKELAELHMIYDQALTKIERVSIVLFRNPDAKSSHIVERYAALMKEHYATVERLHKETK